MAEKLSTMKDQLDKWWVRPDLFMEECLRIPLIKEHYQITEQQKDLYYKLGNVVYSKLMKHSRDIGVDTGELEDWVLGLAKKIGISIHSGKGIGKTSGGGAWLILWFLCCAPTGAKGYVLAPKQEQLKTGLWAEVRLWVNQILPDGTYAFLLRDYIDIQSETIYFVDNKKNTKLFGQLVVNRSTDEEQMKASLQGKHAENMLCMFEEGSGIVDAAWAPILDTQGGAMNVVVALGNPNLNHGMFYDTHYDKTEQKRWVQLRWNAEESPLAGKDWLDYQAEKYGIESDYYRVNVLGLPPIQGKDRTLIPREWINAAVLRESEVDKTAARVMTIDVALGGDMTSVKIRQGFKITYEYEFSLKRSDETYDVCVEIAHEQEADVVVVDANGAGEGVYALFMGRKQFPTFGFKAHNVALDPTKFHRLKDECWWRVREWYESGLADMPDNDKFIDDVSFMDYEREDGHILKVLSKDKIKKLLGRSTDDGDSLMMGFMKTDRQWARYKKNRRSRSITPMTRRGGRTWKSA